MVKKINICKNCGHPIKKRYFMSQGQSMWEWTHSCGGNYCKISMFPKQCGECFCSNAEPYEEKLKDIPKDEKKYCDKCGVELK